MAEDINKELERLREEAARLEKVAEAIALKERIDAQHKAIAKKSFIDKIDYLMFGKTFR